MTKDEIVQHLLNLGNGIIKPINTRQGLCAELGRIIGTCAASKLITKYAMTWEYWSGSEIYPVPHSIIIASSAFALCVDKWAYDEYGGSRRELCLHIARELMKDERE